MWVTTSLQEIADEPPGPSRHRSWRPPGLATDGRRIPGREGTPVRLPPDGRGLRQDALAVLGASRLAGSGDADPRPRLGPRDRCFGQGAFIGDGRGANRLRVELLPVPHPDERRLLEPVRL